MSKTETWRDAARRQNEQNLINQTDRMTELAAAAEILAESMARLSEETRESVNELKSAAESVKGETTTAGNAHQKSMHELTATAQETRSALSVWKSQLETSVNESERRIKGSLRGIIIKLWLAVILTAILSGALTGWLIFRWCLYSLGKH